MVFKTLSSNTGAPKIVNAEVPIETFEVEDTYGAGGPKVSKVAIIPARAWEVEDTLGFTLYRTAQAGYQNAPGTPPPDHVWTYTGRY